MDFTEILSERNRELYFSHFNINEKKFLKKRLLISLIFFLLYLAIIMNQNKLWLLAGIPIVMYLGYKLPYAELVKIKNRHDLIKQYEFPTFLRYFISLYYTQGNVYQTIKATIPYIHEPMKSDLKLLLEQLDEKNSDKRQAFIRFAEKIGSSEAYMIMEMIYEFYEEGTSMEDINELENTVKSLQENKVNELIEYKVSKMSKHADPILVYGLLFIFLFTGLTLVAYMKQINFNF